MNHFNKILVLIYLFFFSCNVSAKDKIVNVSFDSTRELYKKINKEFVSYFKNKHKKRVRILQSSAGSTKQARSIVEGMPAHIISLASAYDIDFLVDNGFVDSDWRKRYPNNSCPYGSTIVFIVKKGNPKKINNWDDLVNIGVDVITPNPKTSGAARWNYLAAWIYALEKYKDEILAKEFLRRLYLNVPVLDTSARTSTITFLKRNIGDVLITWESDALSLINSKNESEYEIIAPNPSLKINLPVVISEVNTNNWYNDDIAKEYIDFLYSTIVQHIYAEHKYRPLDDVAFKNNEHIFVKIDKMVDIDNLFDSKELQEVHFANGGVFDQLYER